MAGLLEKVMAPTAEDWDRLTAPFPPEQIGLRPQPIKTGDQLKGRCENTPDGRRWSADGKFCGGWHSRSIHLDYVGHAYLTIRLNTVCTPAGWNWAPLATHENGLPVYSDGGLWIILTIWGESKLGFGDAQGKTGPNSIKEIIGDALRNAGLRFGIATELWAKGERKTAESGVEEPDSTSQRPEAPRQQPNRRQASGSRPSEARADEGVPADPYEQAHARAVQAELKLRPFRQGQTRQEREDQLMARLIEHGLNDDPDGWNDLAAMLESEGGWLR